MIRLHIIIILSLGLLGGCSILSTKPTSHDAKQYDNREFHKLYNHYKEWEGVKHRLGGNDQTGIDCSGFVQITYKEIFNQSVPRTTKLLSTKGEKIKQKSLVSGDLIFFKTGFRQRHVGIYMGNNTFMHVSKKRGVMISNLDNPYWKDTYWQSRRLM